MKELSKLTIYFIAFILSIFQLMQCACAIEKPIATDSRIKTFIYSRNEVFRIVVHSGYQTVIEFGDGEEIQTISAGNNYAWSLNPIKGMLVIKPLEDNITTNMTIITNMRIYQFELQSKAMVHSIDEELVYVARFFYPDDGVDQIKTELFQGANTMQEKVKAYNFNYTLEGSDNFAPVKVFDDGANTFMEFDKEVNITTLAFSAGDNASQRLVPARKGGYVVLNTVTSVINVNNAGQVVRVYNENYDGRR